MHQRSGRRSTGRRGTGEGEEAEKLRFLQERPFSAWEQPSEGTTSATSSTGGDYYKPIADTPEDAAKAAEQRHNVTEVLRMGSLMLAALLALGAMLVYLRFLMVPLVFSRFLVYVFQPLVKYLSGRRPFSCMGSTVRLALPKWASILVILSLIIVTLLFMCMVLGLTVQDVLANSEYYVLRLERLSNSMISFAENMGYDKERLKELLPEFQAGTYVMQILEFLFNRFPELILVLLIVVYMLIDLEDQEEQLLHHPRTLAARRAHRIDKHIRTYVFIHTLISLTAAVITTFILFVFEVDFCLVVGLITFALGYIPNVGPAIAIVLPIPLIVLDPRPIIVRTVFITIFLAATQFSLTQLVEPKVLGRVMNIPPVTILVALLFWSSVWGIVGAIISVPLTVSIKMYLEALDHPAPQAIASFLMGNFQALDLTRIDVKEDEDVVDLQAPPPRTSSAH